MCRSPHTTLWVLLDRISQNDSNNICIWWRNTRIILLSLTLFWLCVCMCLCVWLTGEEDLLHTGLLWLLQKAAVPGFPLSDLWLQVPPALQHRGSPHVCQLWPARVSDTRGARMKNSWSWIVLVIAVLEMGITQYHLFLTMKLQYRSNRFFFLPCNNKPQKESKMCLCVLFSPGITICPEWSHHKWTALNTGVKCECLQDASRMHLRWDQSDPGGLCCKPLAECMHICCGPYWRTTCSTDVMKHKEEATMKGRMTETVCSPCGAL